MYHQYVAPIDGHSFGIQFVKIMILDGLVYIYKCQSGLKSGPEVITQESFITSGPGNVIATERHIGVISN